MKKLSKTTENSQQLAETNVNGNELEWENNHAEIGNAIIKHLMQYGTMPAKSTIGKNTGLSRETVYKHLRTYGENPVKQNTADTFGAMNEHVIASVLKAALKGDLNAARLFLETSKTLQAPKQQNNFVQINKTIINQQIIQQLKPEQLNQIEQIIAKQLEEQGVDKG